MLPTWMLWIKTCGQPISNPIKKLTKCYEGRTLIETILSFQAEKLEKKVWKKSRRWRNQIRFPTCVYNLPQVKSHLTPWSPHDEDDTKLGYLRIWELKWDLSYPNENRKKNIAFHLLLIEIAIAEDDTWKIIFNVYKIRS